MIATTPRQTTPRQTILRHDACRSLIVMHYAVRVAYAIRCATGWVLDRLDGLSRRHRRHASDLVVLGRLEPLPEHLRR